ncbi:ABC transporter permease subunit [Natronolimnohabitans sp. A-GB9]|uniref:ABC transporter permease n=1 Tax=Natronolimnohabitans sp. A-GB9 TaxID=3069757 RepID=UPI0027B0D9C6|nr:ABC transporter permease subunit [Natronolimnohabitans sp. A-GB9]MDQ2050338.1 ABC transporter permease subunit [Natronolimnohabitans sp. A-GB9]
MSAVDDLALFVREDVRDTFRERQFHLLVGIYVLFTLLVTYTAGQASPADGSAPELTSPLISLFAMLTPLLALGFFASVLVEKRASGALKYVFGLPVSRRAAVLGTFIGRSMVLCTAVFLSLLAAVPLAAVLGVTIDPVRYVTVALLLVLLGVTFTALAIAISAIVRTTTRATVAAFGVFVVFFFQLWGSLPLAVLYVRHGFSYPETTPEWVDAVAAVNPVAAYAHLLAGRYPDLNNGTLIQPPTDPAFYETPSFALVVLIGWIVGAVGIGYWRFRTTDL